MSTTMSSFAYLARDWSLASDFDSAFSVPHVMLLAVRGTISMMTAPATKPRLRLIQGDASPRAAEESDAELVAAFLLRRSGAAEVLHDRVRPIIEAAVRRLLGSNDPDADDAVQNALVETVYSLDRWRGGCSLVTWVTTIASRVVYKSLRRRRLERRIFETDVFAAVNVPAADDIARDARLRGLLLRLRAHLAALDEQKSWAFVLHDICGHDVREVADIMGASISAIQQRLSRCRRELAARIASDPELKDAIVELGGSS